MFTWGSKYLFAISAVSLLGAAVYGLISGGDVLGVISIGYRGGIGDHTGYAILATIGSVAAGLGVLNLITRDGDADEGAAAVGAEGALAVSTPRTPSYWGPLGAFGVACLLVGVAVSQAFFILGIVVLSVVTLEWLVLAWADRATGDEDVNRVIRNRVLGPIEVPMLATLGIAVLVIGLSRVLLAVPSEAASTTVASLAAAAIFGAAVGISKANASRSVITGVVAVAALAVLAGGILGAVVGEREIAHHGESDTHGESHDDGGEGEGE
jgi:hypothetical protein